MTQPGLFPPQTIFGDRDGETFDPRKDRVRLNRQAAAVYSFMIDGKWRTLHEISLVIDAPEASVSARLRDLRKDKFGGYVVERRRRSVGTHEYRVLV